MKILIDKTGIAYELYSVGNDKVELRSKMFPEINHTYKATFIEAAIKKGLLIELPEGPPKFIQEELSLMQGQGGQL